MGFQSAKAQETPPIVAQPLAQFKIYPDRADLEFADGRKARLMISERVNKTQLKTSLQLIENVCAPEVIGEGCEWSFDYIDARLAFLWVEHPDPAKLNQVLKVKVTTQSSPPNPSSSFERILENNTGNLFHPFLFPQKAQLILSCKDDRWLHQMYEEKLKKFIVKSWTAEFMQQNEITSKNENMGQLQINSSELIPLGEGRYLFQTSDTTASLFAYTTPLQETQTLYFQQQNKQCSIQLKNSLDEIRKAQPEDPTVFVNQYPAILPAQIPKAVLFEQAFRIGDIVRTPVLNQIVEVD